MIFGNSFYEGANENNNGINDVDMLAGTEDPNTEDGLDTMAAEVETNMQAAALESVTFFENGDVAQKNFIESAEVQALVEARKMSKRTFVRLNKNDDFTRRCHLASLILARNNNDPLFHQLAANRVKERKLRNMIFKKYESKSKMVARRSQNKHIKAMKSMPSMPVIKLT